MLHTLNPCILHTLMHRYFHLTCTLHSLMLFHLTCTLHNMLHTLNPFILYPTYTHAQMRCFHLTFTLHSLMLFHLTCTLHNMLHTLNSFTLYPTYTHAQNALIASVWQHACAHLCGIADICERGITGHHGTNVGEGEDCKVPVGLHGDFDSSVDCGDNW